MRYKSFQNLFFLSLFVFFLSSANLGAEESLSKSAPAYSEMIPEKKEAKRLPDIRPEKSGPFISSNTGYSFLFKESKYMLSSPSYEGILGYHIGNSYKIALSYQYQHAPLDVQHQGVVFVAGKAYKYDYKESSGLDIQTASIKFYTSPPQPMRWKIFTFSPFVSIGTGLGWANQKSLFPERRSIFIGELGFCAGTSLISATAGCKYANWSWDNSNYSITPYLGLQVSF